MSPLPHQQSSLPPRCCMMATRRPSTALLQPAISHWAEQDRRRSPGTAVIALTTSGVSTHLLREDAQVLQHGQRADAVRKLQQAVVLLQAQGCQTDTRCIGGSVVTAVMVRRSAVRDGMSRSASTTSSILASLFVMDRLLRRGKAAGLLKSSC